MLFFLSTYFASIQSKKYEAQREAEIRAKGGFIIFHGPDEMNNWDLGGVGFLVLGSACLLAAFWLARPKTGKAEILSVANGDKQ